MITPAASDLLLGKPYSEEHGSVEMVLIERATHNDPLYTQDDRMLFDKLAAAWSGTELDTCITAQMQRSKKGRLLYQQSVREFANKAKWMEIVTKCEETLTTSKFHGNGNKYSMNMHISRHRVAFSRMEVASRQGKVTFALPDETTRVRHFITSMEDCKDQKLISRIENVLCDDLPEGKNNNFDACVQHLLPACPVYARRKKHNNSNDNEGNKNISVSSVNLKQGKGSTGVDLRWHKADEYRKLSNTQKDELRKWNQTDAGKKASEDYKKDRGAKRSNKYNGGSHGKDYTKKFKRAVAAAVSKEKTDTADKDSKLSELAAKLVSSMSTVNAVVGTKVSSSKVKFSDEAINAKVAALLKDANLQFE